ncbi:MAG: hypothetical protein J3Q66DRAFT_114026 [Benniella sp.]|nr:MAG: hypothetical protein J3Q66DRAFT_114026 [Benniella sp.]
MRILLIATLWLADITCVTAQGQYAGGCYGCHGSPMGAYQDYGWAPEQLDSALDATSRLDPMKSELRKCAGLLSSFLATVDDYEEGRYAVEVAKLMVVAITTLPDYGMMLNNVEVALRDGQHLTLKAVRVVDAVKSALVVGTVDPIIDVAGQARSSVNYLVKRVTPMQQDRMNDPYAIQAEDLKRLEAVSVAGSLTFLDLLDMLSVASEGEARSTLELSLRANFPDTTQDGTQMADKLWHSLQSALVKFRSVKNFIHGLRDTADIKKETPRRWFH